MQKVHVFLELIEHVANELILFITIHIVGTATATQENLGTIILFVTIVIARNGGEYKARLRLSTQSHLVFKRHFLTADHGEFVPTEVLVVLQ